MKLIIQTGLKKFW